MEQIYKDNFYPTFKKFKQILNENKMYPTDKQIKEFIDKDNIAQIHKTILPQKRHIWSLSNNAIWQIDLIDYQKHSRSNQGFNFLLVCIDIFSRYAFVEPIKNKTAMLVKNAFEKIIRTGYKPIEIIHDEGNEFLGSFLNYCNSNNIKNYAIRGDTNHRALSVVDRFCKTLKTIIARNMTANKNTNYTNILQPIVRLYNNTPHKGILEYKPIDIYNGQHFKKIYDLNIKKLEITQQFKHNEVNVGDKVRFAMRKNNFTKGYEQNFSKNTYTVTELIDKEHCKLSNNYIYRKQDVLIVPQTATDIDEEEIQQENTQNRVNRALRETADYNQAPRPTRVPRALREIADYNNAPV